MKLHDIITARDISEEKLKKSSLMPIELPKFHGFGSKLDIYNFKSEFQRLMQPKVQSIY